MRDRFATRALGTDVAGMLVSCLCIAHCIALPLALSVRTVQALLADHEFALHASLLACAFPLSALSSWTNWRRHRDEYAAGKSLLGLILIAAPLLLERAELHGWQEDVAVIVGGWLLASAHLRSARRCLRGGRC
jgi:hypothetical protein